MTTRNALHHHIVISVCNKGCLRDVLLTFKHCSELLWKDESHLTASKLEIGLRNAFNEVPQTTKEWDLYVGEQGKEKYRGVLKQENINHGLCRGLCLELEQIVKSAKQHPKATEFMPQVPPQGSGMTPVPPVLPSDRPFNKSVEGSITQKDISFEVKEFLQWSVGSRVFDSREEAERESSILQLQADADLERVVAEGLIAKGWVKVNKAQ